MTGAGTRDHRVLTACRICRLADLELVVSLGVTPLANSFVDPARAGEPERRFPLEAVRCTRCGLVQLSVVVNPALMFGDYLYSSSASLPTHAHFDELAEELVGRFPLRGACVVEIGSNDGILLKPLRDRGVAALGVEPAANMAAIANRAGLETRVEFFSSAAARAIAAEKGRAQAVLANNVFAHIDDIHDFLGGLDTLLTPDGVFVAEVPYLQDLFDQVEYDTMYHEHLSYFALGPLEVLAKTAGMEVFDVQRIAFHGGSIRVFMGRAGRHAPTSRLHDLRRSEESGGLLGADASRRFAERVVASRVALRDLLGSLRASGKRLAGLGASAKGNTLLNYCGIGPETLDFIGDSTPYKQGLLTPGTHIPVREDGAILTERPDYTLLLAWNYADDIVRRYRAYAAAGGCFIHPVPTARLLT
ncbi:MAG: class I SAM-dependent methyltransferase [Chloroflexi bacterium]|nr:class I SAM-dependent methyltransferase [Chloroflexota bacterium]